MAVGQDLVTHARPGAMSVYFLSPSAVQADEGKKEVLGLALVSATESSAACQPGHGPFVDPPVAAETL
ncbi:hypothetical protein GTW69_19355 [Streptomyces sp. SID7760]|nr:hypothetical protein [Streptomyces sp. SID7760]